MAPRYRSNDAFAQVGNHMSRGVLLTCRGFDGGDGGSCGPFLLTAALEIPGSREHDVDDVVDAYVFERPEDATDLSDRRILLRVLFECDEPLQCIHAHNANLGGMPRPANLRLEIAGVLATNNDQD